MASENEGGKLHKIVEAVKDKASQSAEKDEQALGRTKDGTTPDSAEAEREERELPPEPTPVMLNQPSSDVPEPLAGPGMPASG